MNIFVQDFKIVQFLYLVLYYGFARWLPKSNTCFNMGDLDEYVVSIFLRNVVNVLMLCKEPSSAGVLI